MHPKAVLAALALVGLAAVATPALADFSGCESAYVEREPHEKIRLYNICLTKGGIQRADIAGGLNNRGVAFLDIGETDKAMADFTLSIEYNPDGGWPYLNRGKIYESRRDWAKALADYESANRTAFTGEIRAAALNAEAWLLATCPDPAVRNGAKAVQLAQQAVKRDANPRLRDTLAAAYAETGKFEDAVREETDAIERAKAKNLEMPGADARLHLFQAGQAFHRT
jgi:tetratricopeptide (TPR) repeat protein